MRYTILLLPLFFVLSSCRQSYNCFAKDNNGVIKDTVECNCYKQTIEDLEKSTYTNEDGEDYKIFCE